MRDAVCLPSARVVRFTELRPPSRHQDQTRRHERAPSETGMRLRLCPTPGCPTLTVGGPCPVHRRQRERQRGTAHARGYTYTDWQPFRRLHLRRLVEAGILPVCGAALPSGPAPTHSQCHQQGVLTWASLDGSSLHLDHDPPLCESERQDPRAVCDSTRIVLLCQACHAAKTMKENR